MPEYERYCELWRVVEWKDGAVYRTEFVRKDWVPMDATEVDGLQVVAISTNDPDSQNLNIRKVANDA